MNSLERYQATLRGEPVDHLARIPILMQFAAEHIGSDYGTFASDYRILTKANEVCARDFGMDQLSCISDPYRETQGFGAEIVFDPKRGPRCVAPPLADLSALAGLPRPRPLASYRMRDRIEAVREYSNKHRGQFSILGWVEGPAAEAADLRGMESFFFDLMEEPDAVGELMDRCVEVALDFARHQIDAGADTIGIGDAAASQVSPAVYQSLILPRERLLIQGIREMGARTRLHICGNITHLLPGIATLGIDVLDVDHMVDLKTAREAVGPAVTLAGNMDPVQHVLQSNPAAIEEAVIACYRAAGYPFMVNAGCEIPSGTPPENLRALCRPVACDA